MPFKTAWLFQNPHFQTIWPALFRYTPKPAYTRERIELRDGDFIDIDWCRGDKSSDNLVILFHGLEGSSHSPYILGMVNYLARLGIQSVAVNFRGCSGEMNRLPRAYHSGATDDLDEIITELKSRHPDKTLHAIGYSLGGNALLKWCAEKAGQNPLGTAIAVSVPYKLAVASKTLDGKDFFSFLYRRRLLKSLKKKTLQKIQQGILDMDPNKIKQIKKLYDFDDQVTAPLHGYAGADDYYHQASSYSHLDKIQVPTLLLHAEDDPFMNSDVIPENTEESRFVKLELSPNGGHVGFFTPSSINGSYWLESRILNYLRARVGVQS